MWKKVENITQSFVLEDEPEMIHIIKTGYKDLYIVVHENGYDMLDCEKVEFVSAQQIKDLYKIDIERKNSNDEDYETHNIFSHIGRDI